MSTYLYIVEDRYEGQRYDTFEIEGSLTEATKYITKYLVLGGEDHKDLRKDLDNSVGFIMVMPLKDHSFGDVASVLKDHKDFHEALENKELEEKELAEYQRLKLKFEEV